MSLFLSAPALVGPSPVRRRYGGRRVARAERVVFALGHARESADAALLAVGGEQVAPARDYLVRIGLMAHVPHEFVVRGVVNVMYGYGQLHRAEARRQMARVFRTLLDDVLTQLAAVARQLRDGEPLQIGGRIDLVEQVVIYMIHVVCVYYTVQRFVCRRRSSDHATEHGMPAASTRRAIASSSARGTLSSVGHGVSRSSE